MEYLLCLYINNILLLKAHEKKLTENRFTKLELESNQIRIILKMRARKNIKIISSNSCKTMITMKMKERKRERGEKWWFIYFYLFREKISKFFFSLIILC